jgi:D-beta-D-heptose 7-phosphate kinase/D-beta-D-heptose 1-phosphate adenosyltransferase
MSLWRKEGVVHARGRAVEVFDVSGAGDTVVATVAGALSAGCDMETAMALAGHAAAIVVSKLGTAFVSAHELNRACLDSTLHQGDAMTLDEARRTCDVWRNRGESIVFTNGCFDLLHPGHLALLKAAAAQGDRLVVALNSDASVRRLKGPMRPIQSEQDRASIIAALRMVDIVLLFDEDTPLETIMTLRPDVLVKGPTIGWIRLSAGHLSVTMVGKSFWPTLTKAIPPAGFAKRCGSMRRLPLARKECFLDP